MSKQTDSFYNKFSFFYPLVDIFLKPQKKVLFNEINSLPEGSLLEIGVGNGAHLQLYKRHKIIGIDISAAMLETARKKSFGDIEGFQDGWQSTFV
jgi:phosphatidylethanolamine/phosphatidyl-N-methylethanolamine N-methyltransferase